MEETIFVSNSPPGDSWTLKHDRYGPLEHLASPVCSDSMLFSGVHLSDESPLYDLIVIHWASQGVLVVKNTPANTGDCKTQFQSLGWEDPLGEGVTTCSRILAWRIPRTEEPGGLWSIGS